MTTAQLVKTSVTNNSLSKDYLHPDDHAKQITVCLSVCLSICSAFCFVASEPDRLDVGLPSIVRSCKLECYVDDSKLYIRFPTRNEIENAITFLNKDMNRVCHGAVITLC